MYQDFIRDAIESADNYYHSAEKNQHSRIEIRVTGLRPGEKLYEERLMAEEGLRTTQNGRISIARPLSFDVAAFEAGLTRLRDAAYAESENIRELVAALVPTYTP